MRIKREKSNKRRGEQRRTGTVSHGIQQEQLRCFEHASRMKTDKENLRSKINKEEEYRQARKIWMEDVRKALEERSVK